MRKIVFISVLIMLINNVNLFSQVWDNTEAKHYSGTISTFPVSMDLFFHKDTVFGTYYYDRVGERISLFGKNTDNYIELKENTSDDNFTGVFSFKINADNSFSGQWQSPDGSKKYDFSATEDYLSSCRLSLYKIDYSANLLDNPDLPETTYELYLWLPVTSPSRAGYNNLKNNVIEDIFYGNCNSYDQCIIKMKQEFENNTAPADTSEIIENPWMYAWEFYAGTSVVLNDNNFLVLSYNTYQYLGGAHGISDYAFINYDLNSGNRVTFDDILNSKYEDELLDLILQQLDEDDKTDELFSVDEVFVSKNVGFDKHGVIFMYNVYEITPYVVGPVEVKISYSKLKDYLTDDFKTRMGL